MSFEARQDALAVETVRYGADRSREIANRLDRTGVRPGDVRGVSDLAAVPPLSKDDLPALHAADPPFGGMLAVPVRNLARVFRSPGPINDPEGRAEDYWGMSAAVKAGGFLGGDVVLNSLSYHLTPGGAMLDSGLRAAGCVPIPGGSAKIDDQVAAALAADAAGYAGTPQFLLSLLERMREVGRMPFRRALVTAAPLPVRLRRRIRDEFEVDVYQAYGTADAGLLGFECLWHDGWHVPTDKVIEIVDPGTGAPLAPGEVGEVVVTSPNPTYPLLRFATGDLSALTRDRCGCEREGIRLTGFLGRVGAGVKVRGMFVHPRELGAELASDALVGRWRASVATGPDGRDLFTVLVEPAAGAEVDDGWKARLAAQVGDASRVRPEVQVVAPGTIIADAEIIVDERDGSDGR